MILIHQIKESKIDKKEKKNGSILTLNGQNESLKKQICLLVDNL